MFQKLIIRFLYENGSKAINSVINAYKHSVRNAPKASQQQNDNNKKDQQGGFGKFSFNNLVSTPMTKDESMKILNFKEEEKSAEVIMDKFDKYFEANDPMKGGSFYIQNKIYYAKELLMEDYPKSMNKSVNNPDGKAREASSNSKDEKEGSDSKTESEAESKSQDENNKKTEENIEKEKEMNKKI